MTSIDENGPLVSIITVVYNGEKYLEQTIKSVINQEYKNIEYVIIDGGSTDSTLEIINKYKRHIDYLVSEPDKGLYDAMNKGIKVAKGELIGIINSDDWYENYAIGEIVKAYLLNPEKKIFHGHRYDVSIDGSKKLRKFNKSRLKLLYYGMTYNHPSMFVHKSVYKKYTFNPNLKALSDYEFVLRNFLEDRLMFNFLDISYVNYRLDGISSQLSFKEEIEEGLIARENCGFKRLQKIKFVVLKSLVHLVSTARSFLIKKIV